MPYDLSDLSEFLEIPERGGSLTKLSSDKTTTRECHHNSHMQSATGRSMPALFTDECDRRTAKTRTADRKTGLTFAWNGIATPE